MPKQSGEFDQLAGIVPQISEREGMAQRMGGYMHALKVRASGEAADDRLNRADRERCGAAAQKEWLSRDHTGRLSR